jgi:hypothetical protein
LSLGHFTLDKVVLIGIIQLHILHIFKKLSKSSHDLHMSSLCCASSLFTKNLAIYILIELDVSATTTGGPTIIGLS